MSFIVCDAEHKLKILHQLKASDAILIDLLEVLHSLLNISPSNILFYQITLQQNVRLFHSVSF